MSKSKDRQEQLAAEAAAVYTKTLPPKGRARNPRGFVVEARTDGRGVTLRCSRCKESTVGSRKQSGIICKLTRGCHGRLQEVA